MTRVRFLSPALAEVADATKYYDEHSPKAAADFLDTLDQAIDLLRNHPALGHPTECGARRLTLSGYPYDLIYRVEQEELIVNALAHHRRKPFYWAARM